jgi:hypothetical protein
VEPCRHSSGADCTKWWLKCGGVAEEVLWNRRSSPDLTTRSACAIYTTGRLPIGGFGPRKDTRHRTYCDNGYPTELGYLLGGL